MMFMVTVALALPLLTSGLSDPYRGTKFGTTGAERSGRSKLVVEEGAAAFGELKTHIAEVCQQAGPNPNVSHFGVAVETRYNLAYCIHNKAASSTIMQQLYRLHDPNVQVDFNQTWSSSLFGALRPQGLGIENAGDLNAYRRKHGTFVFSFVRHPFERLVSAFIDKVESTHDSQFRWLRERVQGSFSRFVDVLLNEKPWGNHWSRWSDHCDPCGMDFDFIGRVENFTADMRYMVAAAGLEGTHLDVSLMVGTSQDVEKSDHGNRTATHFATLSPAKRQALYDFYSRDFELLGYSPHPYL